MERPNRQKYKEKQNKARKTDIRSITLIFYPPKAFVHESQLREQDDKQGRLEQLQRSCKDA